MKKVAAIVLVSVLSVAAMIAFGVWMVVPKVADEAVKSRLERVEARTGWTVTYQDLSTAGLGNVTLDKITVSHQDTQIASVASINASIDIAALVAGDKKLSSLKIDGVQLQVTLKADGSVWPLDTIQPKASDKPNSGPSRSLAERLAQIPNLEATNVQVDIVSDEGAPNLGISQINVERASMEAQDDGFHFEGAAGLVASETAGYELPTRIDGTLDTDAELRPRGGKLNFDTPLTITGLQPLPFAVFGLSGAEVSESGVLVANDVHIDIRGKAKDARLFQALRIGVALEKLPRSLDELKVLEVTATEPVLYMDYDAGGGNSLNDVWVALEAPQTAQIVATAKSVAERKAAKLKVEPLDTDEDAQPKGPSRLAKIEALVKRWAPQTIRIEKARVVGLDERKLPLDRQSREFSLENASLVLQHDLGESRIRIDGGFDALGDGAALGKAKAKLDLDYQRLSVSGDISADAIDLSWAGQLLGRKMRRLVGGGTFRASLKLQSQGERAFGMTGMVSVDDLTVTAPIVAEEPLTGISSSYQFSAKYSSNAAMPDPKLLDVPIYEEKKVEDGQPAPTPHPAPKGSLVFEAGNLTFNGAKATFRPAFYGFNAPSRLPARLDLVFALPKTDVMRLFDAVPTAIQGPLTGTKMAGSLSVGLDVEIPLYRASDMKWDSRPVLEAFELLSIPQAVDVRRLMQKTKVTIKDSIEDEDDFERTITLQAPTPAPAQWLIDHAGLTIEEIDERRRERGWPPVPSAQSIGMAPAYVASPQYWLSNAAAREDAAKPWNDDDPLQGISKDWPLGNYVFVPLRHISAYMPKAVMTTEDNSFFTHSGFNMHALRASIERNIEAMGFKRGASTIAMQMVKNVFLNRKKLLSRKIQEAFLVFLMESAVDIPKARIMEVYLNVIEFGPGIFGIHDAAVYYFGKRPDKLTLGEVAWFVSIIPNPKKYHFYYERGAISDSWFSRMKRYIQVMYNRERITQEELDAALLAAPEFYKPKDDEPRLRPTTPPPSLLWDDLGETPSPLMPTTPAPEANDAPMPTPLDNPKPKPNPWGN